MHGNNTKKTKGQYIIEIQDLTSCLHTKTKFERVPWVG